MAADISHSTIENLAFSLVKAYSHTPHTPHTRHTEKSSSSTIFCNTKSSSSVKKTCCVGVRCVCEG